MVNYKKSAYEKLRDEKIRKNEERMKELGLDKNLLKKIRTPKKAKTSVVRKVTPGQERRSRRLAASSPIKNTMKGAGDDVDDLVMLDYRIRDGQEKVSKQRDYFEDKEIDCVSDDDDDDQPPRPTPRRSRRVVVEKLDLSEKDKQILSDPAIDHFLSKFQEFLEFENKISEENTRNVMRQAKKFLYGEGVRYDSKTPGYAWPEGRYFMKGRKVKPTDDMIELMREGKECEVKWGKDRGNGWLLSHPLKKLHLFQVFILEHPDFLKTKLRTRY